MKRKVGIGPSGVISGGGGGSGTGGGAGAVGNEPVPDAAETRRNEHQAGLGGECVCPACGHETPRVGTSACREMACPACGARMLEVSE